MPHKKRINKQIVVVGNVGVGKSTLAGILEKALPAKQVPADGLYKLNPFFPLAVEDRKRWSLTSDIWFLYERVQLSKQTPTLLNQGQVVVDSGLPMSYVYAHSRMGEGYYTKNEWHLYQKIYIELVTEAMMPDLILYLKAPVEVLRQRIIGRGREFEIRFHSIEYLRALENSLEELMSELKKKVIIIEIDAVACDFLNDPDSLKLLINKIGV